jgi:N-acetylmuramoyl-L-alanine amidase
MNILPDNHLQAKADVAFLALVAWREARNQTNEAVAAVCHCIMNRVARPKWWGKDVMSVVFKKWQFSSMTDPNDHQLTKWPETDNAHWQRCMRIAYGVYTGSISNPVPGADSYYDSSIKAPYWADESKFVDRVGDFFFYDLDGAYERTFGS